MTPTTTLLNTSSAGFGLGLRTEHYQDFLNHEQAVDWLEVITDNFLVDGGKPLQMLERFREKYNLAFHGVSMSIGSYTGLDLHYLQKVKKLANRFEPMWVSDHLCWTHYHQQYLHDLYPLPYTQECANLLIQQIKQAQEILERQLVVENVSSYIRYSSSQVKEWEFLSYVADQADCKLLLDVNNIYVSSVNHSFNPEDYLNGLNPQRIQQIHLAGHSHHGDYIVDTHDAAICEEVWSLYAKACTRFGPVATMIERDANIPPLPELLQELDRARQIFAQNYNSLHHDLAIVPTITNSQKLHFSENEFQNKYSLQNNQSIFSNIVLGPSTFQAPLQLDSNGQLNAQHGLTIYHHAYRARLLEVLSDVFSHTRLFCGSDYFEQLANLYIEGHTPSARSLHFYGDFFAQFLKQQHPDSPELFELAELEWVLRSLFFSGNTNTWTVSKIQEHSPSPCLEQENILLPSVTILHHQSNAWQIWKAIEEDQEVPPAQVQDNALASSQYSLLVWRQDWQPQFCTIEHQQAVFLTSLQQGQSIAELSHQWLENGQLTDANVLASWLQQWWSQEILHYAEPL